MLSEVLSPWCRVSQRVSPIPSWKRVFGYTAVVTLVGVTLAFSGASDAAAAILIAVFMAGVVIVEAMLQRKERRFRQ